MKTSHFQLNSFGEAPPGNPNILFLIINGPSTDSVNAPSSLLRKYGIKVLIHCQACKIFLIVLPWGLFFPFSITHYPILNRYCFANYWILRFINSRGVIFNDAKRKKQFEDKMLQRSKCNQRAISRLCGTFDIVVGKIPYKYIITINITLLITR